MLQSLQDANPNIARVILRRIFPVVVVFFFVYIIVIGVFIYKTTENNIASSHNQANSVIQAQLIKALDKLLSENQNAVDSGELRSQAENALAKDSILNDTMNGLFADWIRENDTTIQRVQYIPSMGVIVSEVTNNRGIPQITDSEQLPRTDLQVLESEAFQSALQSINSGDFYISDFTLAVDTEGKPTTPLQANFSVYVPVFDFINPRGALGTVRFVISADSLLEVINNPILDDASNSPGRQFFLVDDKGNVIADSNAPTRDYLYHLIGQGQEDEENRFHDVVKEFVANSNNSQTTLQAQNGVLFTIREFPTLDSENTAWQLVITDSQGTLFTQFALAMVLVVIASVVIVVAMLYFINLRLVPALTPLMTISQQAQQITTGRPSTAQQEIVTEHDEIGISPISSALTTLTERIQNLSGELSEQSTRHNRDMQIVTNIGRETATLYDIDSLMQRSIELICNELGFYHAQIFLVDDARVNAVLVNSRGEAGQKLLEKGHKLAVGSESIIGTVTSKGIPVIVNDTITDKGLHGYNPFLPDTRAEMALPLIIGTDIIGALDVQSTEVNVFHEQDLPMFQLIADQLAVAINNTQLRRQTDQTIEQVNHLNRQLTRKVWAEAEEALGLDVNYTYNLMDIRSAEQEDFPEGAIVAPIIIRGETIGTLNAAPPENQSFSEGDQAIIRAVAQRVALAIENARLFQETQVVLSETEVLYELSRQLSEATSYDDIMRSIIEAAIPDATGGQIWIFDDYLLNQKPQWAYLATTSTIQYTDDKILEIVNRSKYEEIIPFWLS